MCFDATQFIPCKSMRTNSFTSIQAYNVSDGVVFEEY